MSNTAVGSLYEKVINAVIEASRTDFEENGIDNSTLINLQRKWQHRLTSTHRAQFPWDPNTANPMETAQPPPAGGPPQRQATQNNAPPAASPTQANIKSGPPANSSSSTNIKQEPTYDSSYTGSTPQSGPAYAEERANRLVQEYQNSNPNLRQQPGGSQETQQATPKREPGLATAQTDGAGDEDTWDSVRVARQHVGQSATKRADKYIRRRVEANMQALEAGGLLVPLDQRQKSIRLSPSLVAPEGEAGVESSSSVNKASIPQLDGDNDDDDDPEDEVDPINSDLDDSEDENIGGGIQDAEGDDVILCLYDKVQRVKNKWKCYLKDGVVTVEGKDYVFHKANGEFEW